MFKEWSSDLPKRGLQSLFCRLHTRQPENLCVCRLLFQQKRLTWGSCNQTTCASGVSSTSHPVGSEGLDDVQSGPWIRSFSPAPSGSAGRCGAGATPHRSWSRCRTRGPDWSSPGGLGDSEGCGTNIHQPSHLGHLRKGLQQQVSPTTSRIMRNNPTRPCLSL